MKDDLLKKQLRELLLQTPNYNIFPQEPWSKEDLEEIATIVQHFVDTSTGVIEDENPWAEWLERWRFFQTRTK